MSDTIGINAGKIWAYLDDNGEVTVTKISKETGLNKNDTHRAIGWLAKEEKILFTMKGRSEYLSLK